MIYKKLIYLKYNKTKEILLFVPEGYEQFIIDEFLKNNDIYITNNKVPKPFFVDAKFKKETKKIILTKIQALFETKLILDQYILRTTYFKNKNKPKFGNISFENTSLSNKNINFLLDFKNKLRLKVYDLIIEIETLNKNKVNI